MLSEDYQRNLIQSFINSGQAPEGFTMEALIKQVNDMFID